MEQSNVSLVAAPSQEKFEMRLEQKVRDLAAENNILAQRVALYKGSERLMWTIVIPLSLWGSTILNYLGISF
jgi:hypothetical protein